MLTVRNWSGGIMGISAIFPHHRLELRGADTEQEGWKEEGMMSRLSPGKCGQLCIVVHTCRHYFRASSSLGSAGGRRFVRRGAVERIETITQKRYYHNSTTQKADSTWYDSVLSDGCVVDIVVMKQNFSPSLFFPNIFTPRTICPSLSFSYHNHHHPL